MDLILLSAAMQTSDSLLEIDKAVGDGVENCHTGVEQIDAYTARFDLTDENIDQSRLEILDQLWATFAVFACKSFDA